MKELVYLGSVRPKIELQLVELDGPSFCLQGDDVAEIYKITNSSGHLIVFRGKIAFYNRNPLEVSNRFIVIPDKANQEEKAK